MEDSTKGEKPPDDSIKNNSIDNKRKRTQSESDTESVAKVPRIVSLDPEECGICKDAITNQLLGQPEGCGHRFCLACLIEWNKRNNTCPLDRQVFNKIVIPNAKNENVEDSFDVINPAQGVNGDDDYDMIEEEDNEEASSSDGEDNEEASSSDGEDSETEENDDLECSLCENNDLEEFILRCFFCKAGFHLGCLTPPATAIPMSNGKICCPKCKDQRLFFEFSFSCTIL